jgi:hypothetical protein
VATVTRMSRLLPAGLTLAALALFAAGCGGTDEAAVPATTQPPAATTAAAPPVSGGSGDEEAVRGSAGAPAGGVPAVGDPVPDLVGSSLDGTPIGLADFRGKKVIVHVWSSW